MLNVHSPLNFDSVNVHGRAVHVDQEKSDTFTHFNTLRLIMQAGSVEQLKVSCLEAEVVAPQAPQPKHMQSL